MDQKKRDRIAWIAAIVLVPLLIYLLTTNVFKAGNRPAPAPAAAPAPTAAIKPAPPPVVAPVLPSLDPKIAAEQQKIAERLPRRNPFSATASSVPVVSRPADTAVPARSADSTIKVTAIISRSGSKRMAMINGRLLGEGDRVGEWTVIKVNPQNVLLDNGSRQLVVGAK